MSVDLTENFKKVIRDKLDYFPKVPGSAFLNRFTTEAMRLTKRDPDLLERALKFAIDNDDKFPSIARLSKIIVTEMKLRPIDYIAARHMQKNLKGCFRCGDPGGLVHLMKGTEQIYGYCSCALGKYLSETGSKGMLKLETLLERGWKKYEVQKFREAQNENLSVAKENIPDGASQGAAWTRKSK